METEAFRWNPEIPAQNKKIVSKAFEAEGRTWCLVLSNNKRLCLSLEYLGSSFSDIFTTFEFHINKKEFKHSNIFNRIEPDFCVFIETEKEREERVMMEGRKGTKEAEENEESILKAEDISVEGIASNTDITKNEPDVIAFTHLNIVVYISVRKGLYDSKEEAGFVGLRNLGATCYMNSLLQTLFHIKRFRQDVFLLDPIKRIFYLQKLFYKMQADKEDVDPRFFILNNNWVKEISQHQDIHEFSKIFFDILEEESKGMKNKDFMDKLFQGEVKNYIKCQCGCERSNKETFYDVQVEIRDFCNNKVASSLKEALRNYVSGEMLDKENMYKCETHGPVEAEKGVIFTKLPPVLFILLKRFNMDYETGQCYKINDSFEFPKTLQMDEFLEGEIKENPSFISAASSLPAPSDKNKYNLYSVVVHSGILEDGHYYAFLNIKGVWYKFNDTVVTKVAKEQALLHNYGGKHEYKNMTKNYSAYLLVYINEEIKKENSNDEEEVLIPKKTLELLLHEEKKYVRIFSSQDVLEYTGPGIFNIKSYDYPRTKHYDLEVRKNEVFYGLKNKMKEEHKKKYSYLFDMRKRKNGTLRPVYVEEEDVDNREGNTYFIFYSNEKLDFKEKHTLIFFKKYVSSNFEDQEPFFRNNGNLGSDGYINCLDTFPQSLKMVTCLVVEREKCVGEYLEIFREKLGWDEEIQLEEEISDYTKPIGMDVSFKDMEIKNGDIIIAIKRGERESFVRYFKFLIEGMCLNIRIPDTEDKNSASNVFFNIFVQRTLNREQLSEKIGKYILSTKILITDFPSTVGEANLHKNIIYLKIKDTHKLIYIAHTSEMDLNKIGHLHVVCVKKDLKVSGLLKKLSESKILCMKDMNNMNLKELKELRLVDTCYDSTSINSYSYNSQYTSDGICVIKEVCEKEIKACYLTRGSKILGYPFYIPCVGIKNVGELRMSMKLFQKLYKYNGVDYYEMNDDHPVDDFEDGDFMFIDVS